MLLMQEKEIAFGRITSLDAELRLCSLSNFINLKYNQLDEHVVEGEVVAIEGIYGSGRSMHVEKVIRPTELGREPKDISLLKGEATNEKYCVY